MRVIKSDFADGEAVMKIDTTEFDKHNPPITKGYGMYGLTSIWRDEQGDEAERAHFGHGRSMDDVWRKVKGETDSLVREGWKLVRVELKWFIKH